MSPITSSGRFAAYRPSFDRCAREKRFAGRATIAECSFRRPRHQLSHAKTTRAYFCYRRHAISFDARMCFYQMLACRHKGRHSRASHLNTRRYTISCRETMMPSRILFARCAKAAPAICWPRTRANSFRQPFLYFSLTSLYQKKCCILIFHTYFLIIDAISTRCSYFFSYLL